MSPACARELLLRARLIDREGAAPNLLAIQARGGRLSFAIGAHLHERKAPGLTGRLVDHHVDRIKGSEGLEQPADLGFTGLVRQISHIQLATHMHYSLHARRSVAVPSRWRRTIEETPRSG